MPYELKEFKTVDVDYGLNELLCEMNEKFDNKFLVQTNTSTHKYPWYRFKEPKKIHRFSVYYGHGPDVQMINFSSDTGINVSVDKHTVTTFFIGCLAGFDYKKNLDKKSN